jgi:hypothetical protein
MNKPKLTNKSRMNLERFSQLMETYGGEAKRWPLVERSLAQRLLAESAEARRLQQSALRLDHLLAQVPITPPTLALQQRILNQIHPQVEPLQDAWQCFMHWLFGTTFREHLLRPTFALIIPLILGIFLGLSLVSVPVDENLLIAEEMNLLALSSLESMP